MLLKHCGSVTQSCPALCNSMGYSPPASSVHGISQVRILEWIAISFSREIFLTLGLNLSLLHWHMDSLSGSHQGSSLFCILYFKLTKYFAVSLQAHSLLRSTILLMTNTQFTSLHVLNCSVMCLCDPMDCKPARLFCPQNSPGKNTGVPYTLPGHLSDPGIKPVSLASPALAGRFLYHQRILYHFISQSPGKPSLLVEKHLNGQPHTCHDMALRKFLGISIQTRDC